MTSVTKFTFDLDFDAPEEPEEPEVEDIDEEEPEEFVPTFSEEELEQARAEGFEAGKEAGRAEAAEATEQRLLEAVEAAGEKLQTLMDGQAAANADMAKEMIRIAVAIAKKMFPDLNERNALGEVERVVQETLKAITEEPRAQIMLHPDLREPFGERLATMTQRAGFDGKVFVNPDPSLQLGDCRIEWSNGAALRDSDDLMRMIDEIVERNLHGTAPADDADGDDTEAAADAAVAPPAEAAENAAEAPSPEPDPEPAADARESAPPETAAPAADAPPPIPGQAADSGPDVSAATADEDAGSPSFAPSVDLDADTDAVANSTENQDLNDDSGAPPVPHVDDASETAEASAAETDDDAPPTPTFTSPDPVSPETAAAILDAQGAADDAASDDAPTPTPERED